MNNALINELERLTNSNKKDASSIIAKILYRGFINNIFYHIKELSELAHVHESTITVFSKKLGYSGYRELLFVLKLERLKYETTKPKNTTDPVNSTQEFNLTFINHIQVEKNQQIIFDLLNELKTNPKIHIYSSYQLNDLANLFYEQLSLKTDKILFNNTKLYAYKNTNYLTKKDVAIFFVSGQDNDLLEYIFKSVTQRTKKIFVFSSASQKEKFKNPEHFQNLDLINLPSDNLYRHLVLTYYISLLFYLW